MRSKISFYDKSIARQISFRYWPLWVLYAVAVILLGPVSLMSQISFGGSRARIVYDLLNSELTGGTIIVFIGASAAAIAVFTPLYGRDSSVMEAALPVKRNVRYFTSFATGFFWLTAVHAAAFIFMAVLGITRGANIFEASASWFAMITLQSLAFYGIAAFAAMLTGRLIIAVGLTIFIHFASVILGVMGASILQYSLYGYWNDGLGSVCAALSPIVKILNCSVRYVNDAGEIVYNYTEAVGAVFEGWKWLLLYAGAGIVLAAAGLWLYIRRRLETAGETVSEKVIRPIFMCAFTLYGGVALACLIYETFSSYTIIDGTRRATIIMGLCLLIGTFIAYIFGTMILNRSVSLRRRLRGYVLPGVLVIIFVGLCLSGMLGWSYCVPGLDEIRSVEMDTNGYWSTDLFTDEYFAEVTDIHRMIVADRHNTGSEKYVNIWLKYELTDGSHIKRLFKVPKWQNEAEPMYAVQNLFNRPEIIKKSHFGDYLDEICAGSAQCEFNFYYNGNAADINDNEDAREIIIRGIIPDIDAGNMGQSNFSAASDKVLSEAAVSELIDIDVKRMQEEGSLNLTVLHNNDIRMCSFELNPQCVNTLTVLHELGYIK